MAAPKNPVGHKSDKIWRDAVMRAIRRMDETGKTQRLERLADAIVAKGIEGDVPALKEIGDRLDGRVTQSVEHSGSITLGSLIEQIWNLQGQKPSQPSPDPDKSVH